MRSTEHSPDPIGLKAMRQIVDIIEQQFGQQCEVVLHDFCQPYDHTIVDIRNGHITGRTLGGCGSNLGLEVIRGTLKNGDKFNYITHTRDGKILRSSSIYLRDDTGNVHYSLCINQNITESVRMESYLHECNRYEMGDTSSPEVFVSNVGDLLDFFLLKGQEFVGKDLAAMNKDDKLRLLDFLDRKGAFLISKAGIKVCEALNISKFTLYNYLETVRKNNEQTPDGEPEVPSCTSQEISPAASSAPTEPTAPRDDLHR